MSILDQVELGWRYNPLEARNQHGEWTRAGMRWTETGSQYKAPPADRVNIAGLKGSTHPFIAKYGLSSANIVKAYDAATPDERDQGARWYSDAHDVAKAIANGDAAKGAAMLSAFSVQTDWATDMMNAASTLANGKVPDHGVGITPAVRARAQAVLDAKDDDDLDKLFPANSSAKTRNFFYTMRDGGDAPDDTEGRVTIDRHALSVAAGRRLTSQEVLAPTYADMAKDHPDWTHDQMHAYRSTFPDDPTGSIYSYQHIADMYRAAAKEVSDRDGVQISPHQMQAITWMHQIHQNDADDAHLVEMASEAVQHGGSFSQFPGAATAKGRASAMSKRWATVAAYAQAHQIPVHSGTTALSGGILDQILELSDAWMHEPRDSRGRWTRFGGVGQAADIMSKNREGFSVSVRTGGEPAHGFMVAQLDHTHTYPAEILDDHHKLTRAIDDMLMTERSAFEGQDTYLGGWVHDGKLWLEPSDNIQDRDQAVAEGTRRNQIAVWDVDNFQEIDTGGTGGGRITEHANAQDPGQDPAWLLGYAGGAAAGSSQRAGGPDPGGILGQLLDLAGGWRDAWRHELRGPHGEWVKGLFSAGKVIVHPDAAGYGRSFPPQVRTAIEKEIGKDLDIQAKYIPGIANKQVIRIVEAVPDDLEVSGALGETMPKTGEIFMIPRSIAAVNGHDEAQDLLYEQIEQGWWVPIDKKYTAADVIVAHESGHNVFQHLKKNMKYGILNSEYWQTLANAMGIQPPREGKVPGKTTSTNLSNWAWKYGYNLTTEASEYGSSNPEELPAELWAEYTMSSHPRPLAQAYGDFAMAHLPAADLPPKPASAA